MEEKDRKVCDILSLAEKIRKSFKDSKSAMSISTGEEMTTPVEPEDFVVMPEWWQQGTGVLGLPFGYCVMVSGRPDSGKTSCVIEAIRCAQQQNYYVVLADTERKTTISRLNGWGVDPKKLARIQPAHLEDMYDGIDHWWKAIKEKDPNSKILVIVDSLGNTPSYQEVNNKVGDTLQLGIAAKVNKRGLRRLLPILHRDDVALLLINQTYSNMTSVGKTNAGGQIVDFVACLTYQTSRKMWIEKVTKGKKVRVGAQMIWTLTKNHLLEKDTFKEKTITLNITSEGIKLAK